MMKSKIFKVIIYIVNIIMAMIILMPVVYCFNVSMMDMKEIYGGNFWPSHFTIGNYAQAL